MPASIGVNLRVTGHCRQGGRKYMEDFFSVAYQQTEDEKDLEYAFFGIYDGHGGAEAAAFAKEHLMETIIKHKNFWSDNDEDVLRAIKDGYIATHYAMWREQEKWPRTASGLPSTAGTTASIAFIRRGKIYIGHVGDSGITLGYQDPGCTEWKAKSLTRDHKPENAEEMSRIIQCGGKVLVKSGVPRVVWNRPKIGHQGPVRRSTPIDEIPFLAVARSLGDLWSYNSQINQFIVSPDPDCLVIKIDTNIHRCLIFGTDGLYNMLRPLMAVHIVQQAERHNENAALSDSTYKTWLNPSKLLVEKALERWHTTKMRADNTSVVTLMLDPPGPPRAQVLKDRKKNLPERGLRIMTRYNDNNSQENTCNKCDSKPKETTSEIPAQTVLETVSEPVPVASPCPAEIASNNNKEEHLTDPTESTPVSSSDLIINFPLKERNFSSKPRESTSFDPREHLARQSISSENGKENLKAAQSCEDNTIQCNEVSSSNIEIDSTCIEDEELDSTTSGKHNLRSAKKGKIEVPPRIMAAKRKLDSPQATPIPRKSMRIDINLKKAIELVERERKAFEAEEKNKLAAKADVAKSKSTKPMPKLSLAQKILRSKNVNLKKKNLVKKPPVTQKKIQLVIKTMKNVQKSTILLKKPVCSKKFIEIKKDKIEKKSLKAPSKVIVCKVTFRRHSMRNASQCQRNKVVADNGKKNVRSKKQTVEKSTHEIVIPKQPVSSTDDLVHSSPNLLGRGSIRSSLRSSRDMFEPDKGVSSRSSSIKSPSGKEMLTKPQATTLRKKIQQKTAYLRKNVMRRSK